MLRWAEASIIFSVKRLLQVSDLHDVLSAFEEEETSAMAIVYIEPNDGAITDEESYSKLNSRKKSLSVVQSTAYVFS